MEERTEPMDMARRSLRASLLQDRAARSASHGALLDERIVARLDDWVRRQEATRSPEGETSPDRTGAPAQNDVRASPVLALYWPMRGEPDWRVAASDWWGRGLRLALPVMNARDPARCAPGQVPGGLRWALWTASADMVEGRFGVVTPRQEIPVEPDWIVAPCVGFHAAGGRLWRLGYGGGYYDRTLAVQPRPICGVAHDEAQLDAFAPLATDWPLDALVTPTRLLT